MSLARAWYRQLAGASGAAILVPGTIVGVFAVLALSGGFGHLTALNQAFAGPDRPSLAIAGAPRGVRAGIPLAVVLPAGGPRVGGARTTATNAILAATGSRRGATGNGAGTGNSVGGGAGAGGGGTGRGGGSSGGHRGPTSGSPGTPGTGGPPPGGGSGGAPQPTALDTVINAAAGVTSSVPGPLGTVATQTLQSVGTTLDRLLGLGGTGSPGTAGGGAAR